MLTIENKGNIDLGPDSVDLKIMSLNKNELETISISEDKLPKIKAGMTETVTVPFSTTVEAGEYYINVKVNLNNKVLRAEDLVININPVGQSDSGSGQSALQAFVKENGVLIGVVVFIIVVAAALGIVYMSNKKAKKK